MGTDPDDLPITKTGNPKLGMFTRNDDWEFPFKQEVIYVFPYAEIDGYNESQVTLTVAIHADVITYEMDGDQAVITREEGAWGFGNNTFEGAALGWYSEYVIQS